MRRLKLAVLAGTSLLAMTAHAQADFVITPLAFSLFAGSLGSVLSFAAIHTGLTLLATAAGIGASLLFRGGGQRIDPGEFKQTFENEAASEIRCVGRTRNGGLKVFGNTSGFSGFRLIAHCKGPIDFVEEHYLGGRLVVVEDQDDGRVSSPPWGVAASVKPNGSWAFIRSKIGDGTETSWGPLQTYFPLLWTADHRARGIAQTLVQYDSPGVGNAEAWGRLYQGGYPDYERVQRGELVYDPRDQQTRWTDNGILCAAHILRSYPDLTFADFDWADLAIEANKADATVATKSGTEKRARCWGFWQSEARRGDVMAQVLDSIGAEIQMSDAGLIRIRLIDDQRMSDLTFSGDHIVSYALGSGPEAPERPNLCRVSYYSPERNYTLADIDMTGIAWAKVQSEIDAYGEKPLDIELPFCPSASQAQRIARRMFALARADRGTINTNMAGLAAWDRQAVNVQFDDLGETHVCLIDPPRIDDEQGEVEIPVMIQPALAAWNPATMEAAAPEQIPDIEYEAEIEKPEILSVWLVQYPDDRYEIRAVYDVLPLGTAEGYGLYRAYTGGLPGAWTGMAAINVPAGPVPFVYANMLDQPGEVDVRVQVFNADGEASYFSDLFNGTLAINNTAPAAPTIDLTPQDMGNGAIFKARSDAAQVARLTIESSHNGGGWVLEYDSADDDPDKACRPGVIVTHNHPPVTPTELPQTLEFRARAYASDGTASPYASDDFEIPGTL